MLKHNNKTIAIVVALIFCMSFIAPAFFAPDVAEAASTATVVKTATVPAQPNQNLGVIKVVLSDFDYMDAPSAATPWIATVSFPSKLTSNIALEHSDGINVTYGSSTDNALTAGDIALTGPAGASVAINGTFNIKVEDINMDEDEGFFYIHFNGMNCSNYSGDVLVNLAAGSKAFTTVPGLKIGAVNATDKTTTLAKSVRAITSSGGELDNIIIMDEIAGSIKDGEIITVKMESKGFEFRDAGQLTGYWKFNETGPFPGTPGETQISFTAPADQNNGQTKGMVGLTGIEISVDEKVARVGQDIEVTVKGNGGITEQTIVVGKYVDYLVNITGSTTTELIAGREDQTLGEFYIEEVAPGTLVEGRSILLELPSGVEWYDYNLDNGFSFGNSNYEVVNNSSITFNGASFIDAKTLKILVNGPSADAENGAKILFKKLKVEVSPSFKGPIELKVSGKAGAEGTVKVAEVIPMIEMTADAPALQLGIKEQKVSDVIITESKADAIVDQVVVTNPDELTSVSYDTSMKFYLDAGYRFARVPTIEVLEGDIVLELDNVKITTPRTGQNLLIVPIRAGSYATPAKIKISDIYITADRTAPTGKIAIYAAETGADWFNDIFASDTANAFNDTGRFVYDRAAECYLADNTTVPPVENVGTGTATFTIGSNLYTVNGVTRVMDVAPYIKSDRTYVPYRYLAYALGVAEEDVVWDATAKTVTITKGDDVVVATIGSTTLTVNGEAQTIEVAPEISNDRTMLPARFLAEALGATVGWDPATRTVVIEN